jgi:hypothetical protein
VQTFANDAAGYRTEQQTRHNADFKTPLYAPIIAMRFFDGCVSVRIGIGRKLVGFVDLQLILESLSLASFQLISSAQDADKEACRWGSFALVDQNILRGLRRRFGARRSLWRIMATTPEAFD